MKTTLLSLNIVVFVFALSDAVVQAGEDEHNHGNKKAATAVNKVCPISNEAIGNDAINVQHRGKTVALCCKMCKKEWNRLSMADRDAKVVATSAAPVETPKAAAEGDPYTLTVCPVSGKKLGAMGDPVIKRYGDREVRFCCKGCIRRFDDAKAAYLKDIDRRIADDQRSVYPLDTCLVSGSRLGSMGAPVDYVIGNRLVRLCCLGCKRKLHMKAVQYITQLNEAVVKKQHKTYPLDTCLVSGKKLGSMGKPTAVVMANRLMRVCCPGCVSTLKKRPAGFTAKLDAARAVDRKHGKHKHEHGEHD